MSVFAPIIIGIIAVLIITAIPFIFIGITLSVAAIIKWRTIGKVANDTVDKVKGKTVKDASTDELVEELMKRGRLNDFQQLRGRRPLGAFR